MRLNVHLYNKELYFSSTISLWFYIPPKRIIVEGFPSRTFPAKHPLYRLLRI
nr:MAG TPA: hypothetical protein [Caudoviricetes sp.]